MEYSYFDVSDLRNLMDYFIGDDMKSPGSLVNLNIFLEPHFYIWGFLTFSVLFSGLQEKEYYLRSTDTLENFYGAKDLWEDLPQNADNPPCRARHKM